MLDPATMAALAQMGMNFQQGIGSAIGGNSGDWGNALQNIPGGIGIMGSMMSKRRAKKDKRKAQKRFQRALNARESIEGGNLQKQEALARQATAQQLAGFDAAKGEAGRMGRASKQSVLDREKQLGATLTQNLTNRGMDSLTSGNAHLRGISADAQREMSGINEDLGAMLGELAMGRAGAEAQGTQAIAGIAGQQSDLMSQLAQMRMLGGATAGPIGSFDPGSFQPAYQANTGAGMMEGFGSLMGGMGGGGQQDLMKMIQELFGSQMGSRSPAFRSSYQPGGMNLNTFVGG